MQTLPPPPRLKVSPALVEQAEQRVVERDRMLAWRTERLKKDARLAWRAQRGRALAIGAAAGVLLAGAALSRRRRGERHRSSSSRPSRWTRWLPMLLTLAVPLIEPALRRRLGSRLSAWLLGVALAWRPRSAGPRR